MLCLLLVCQSPGVQGVKLDGLLKEEALRITIETNAPQDRWGVNLDGLSICIC